MPNENQHSAVALVDSTSGRIVSVSTPLAQWLGWESGEIQDLSLSDLVPACRDQPQKGPSSQVVGGGSGLLAFDFEVTVTRMIGSPSEQLLVLFRPLTQSDARPVHRDALTGLADRNELEPHREQWRQTSPLQAVPHAVLFLDLNGFKQINDQFGHAVGDRVLQALAPRWQHCIREGDLLARYGGDEFVLLLRGVVSLDDARPIVERLLQATSEPIELDSNTLQVTASIGVALAEDTSCDLQQLLDEADRAMYAAKERNR